MFSLRTILLVASIIQVTVITVAVTVLALRGGQSAVNTLVSGLLVEIDTRVHGQVRALLAEAEQVNAINKAAVDSGLLRIGDRERWRRHFLQQKDVFPTISYFTVGDAEGQWAGLQTIGGLAWGATEFEGRRLDNRAVAADGTLGELRSQTHDYDAFTRDWYRRPSETLQAGWSRIYVWADSRVLSMTLSQPLLDERGAFAGLVAADLALGDIHAYLSTLDVGRTGRAFLIEPDGTLIAASAPPPPFTAAAGEPQRLRAVDYPDETVARTASLLGAEIRDLASLSDPHLLHVGRGRDAQIVRVSPFDDFGLRWILVVVVSEKDFMGEIYATTRRTLLGCGLALLLTVLFSVVYARWISEPLISLAREVRQIQEFKLDNEFKVNTSFLEVARLKDSLARMQTGLCSFRRFVPADLVRRILSLGEEARLGGEMREVSVLFSDLRGYSTLSERLTPVQVIEFMNTYFQAMQEVIARHRGVVLELLGDAILVVFGAPDDLPDHAAAATDCALAMRERLERLNASLPVPLGHRIGIHTGPVVAGNIGGHSYMKYGVIGDVVNVAARLEQLNKTLGTSVLVSEVVERQLPAPLRARGTDRGEVALKGRAEPQHVFSF